jgi:glyoxylase-like metal-dependent hydrolase (beta-lactamase superfamily II)
VAAQTDAEARAWTEPGAFPVAPGVHRIPLPLPMDGLRAVNVYAVDDGDRLVLIDSGWALAESRAALDSALASIGRGPADVRQVLVTHIHRDHYTQALRLRADYGTRVSLGAGEKESIELILSPETGPLHPQVDHLIASGAQPVLDRLRALGLRPPRDDDRWEAPDEWLEGGQEIELETRTLRVIPTPGHTQGHVVFADLGSGLLFAGDHVLPHITPSIGFEPVMASQPLADYLDSLRVLRQLPDLRLLPAHGPVTGSAHQRIGELLAHHAGRLDASEAAIAGGAATAYEAALRLRWTRRDRHLEELDPINQMLAVVETRIHLDLLVTQGRLAVSQQEGVALYRPAPARQG